MSTDPFDPSPARTSLARALREMRGDVSVTEVASRIPRASGDGVGIQRQALMELEGLTCPTCKGSGRTGRAYCDTCGGAGKVYRSNPTLERIETIARDVFGVSVEVTFLYPPGHPLEGQVVTGVAPLLENAAPSAQPEEEDA